MVVAVGYKKIIIISQKIGKKLAGIKNLLYLCNKKNIERYEKDHNNTS